VFYGLFYNDDIQGVLYKNAFFQKLWQHLLSSRATVEYPAAATATKPTTSLYGHTLGSMHSATATEYKIDNAEGTLFHAAAASSAS